MTYVSPEEKEQMEKFLSIMNGSAPTITESIDNKETSNIPYTSENITDPDIKSMAVILERFKNITEETTKELINDSISDSELRQAIVTEKIEDGIRVAGKWEIRLRLDESGSKTKKFYSIIQAGSGTILAENLMIFEAADLLVKLFNNGKTLTSPEVREVLRLEDRFVYSYEEAMHFKKTANRHLKNGDERAADIFEARYSKVKADAISAKNELIKLCQKFRLHG